VSSDVQIIEIKDYFCDRQFLAIVSLLAVDVSVQGEEAAFCTEGDWDG